MPKASSPAALKRMKAAKQKDTKPEVALRRELHRRGLRYRTELSVLKGVRRRADIVFTRAHVVVFVDGCFWHVCPIHATKPKANETFWAEKLSTNQARDLDTNARLIEAGWTVIRVWEHEDPKEAADRIDAIIRPQM